MLTFVALYNDKKRFLSKLTRVALRKKNMNFDCIPELSLQSNGLINDDNITWNSCLDGCKHVLPSVQADFFF